MKMCFTCMHSHFHVSQTHIHLNHIKAKNNGLFLPIFPNKQLFLIFVLNSDQQVDNQVNRNKQQTKIKCTYPLCLPHFITDIVFAINPHRFSSTTSLWTLSVARHSPQSTRQQERKYVMWRKETRYMIV